MHTTEAFDRLPCTVLLFVADRVGFYAVRFTCTDKQKLCAAALVKVGISDPLYCRPLFKQLHVVQSSSEGNCSALDRSHVADVSPGCGVIGTPDCGMDSGRVSFSGTFRRIPRLAAKSLTAPSDMLTLQ